MVDPSFAEDRAGADDVRGKRTLCKGAKKPLFRQDARRAEALEKAHLAPLSRRLGRASLFASFAMLSGCFDYPAVSTLAGSMQQNVASWRPFVDDYPATCQRRLALMQAFDGGACNGLDDQAKQIAAAIKILDNYFGALAAVATDSKFTFDDGLNSVGAEAKKLGAQSAKVDAISAIATTLADLAAQGLRKKAMSRLIAQAGNVGDVVDGLKDIFDKTYRDNLNLEAGKWQQALSHAAGGLGLGSAPKCSEKMRWTVVPALANAEQIQFERFYDDECAKIVARQSALAQFDKSADQLGDSLGKLRTARLSDKAAAQAFFTQSKALLEQAQAIQKAFAQPSTKS